MNQPDPKPDQGICRCRECFKTRAMAAAYTGLRKLTKAETPTQSDGRKRLHSSLDNIILPADTLVVTGPDAMGDQHSITLMLQEDIRALTRQRNQWRAATSVLAGLLLLAILALFMCGLAANSHQ